MSKTQAAGGSMAMSHDRRTVPNPTRMYYGIATAMNSDGDHVILVVNSKAAIWRVVERMGFKRSRFKAEEFRIVAIFPLSATREAAE